MLKRLLIVLPLLATLCVKAQKSADILNYIDTYKEMAIQEMVRTGVPASIKLAQGIHETMAGKSVLVMKSNNHFGIKCKNTWQGKKVYHDDDARGECFRSYSSANDSYLDHSNFLKNSSRYAFLFQLDPTDYKGWAYGLKQAGYATNIKYSQLLIKLIEDYNLQDYSLIALGRLKRPDVILASNKPEIGEPVAVEMVPAVMVETRPAIALAPVELFYPEGEFKINDTRVIYAKSGTSLLAVARQYDISLRRLLDFNDMEKEDVITEDQLLYLQRKRKTGVGEVHVVQEGETLYDICQTEGIRFEAMLKYNHLKQDDVPGIGERIYLRSSAPARPRLATEPALAAVVRTTVDSRPAMTNMFTHVVQTKETLYSIAKKYNVTVEKIQEWNRLQGVDLKIGQSLVIYQ
ncbi:glucosaminidase domain-containing protein [Pseudobacter ginsenosidimutans]|uniref:Peptidoglycan hydrolase n=1 Tax=Pseudobacter ginsenosidimutans TaxID=661488 RepID=A0A4Q7MV02_9BACT|nr:glucosaminidase domain-containing protein [Pseudobacter ginsenosidimutans]QEC40783.1 LysM peptidoglycan-binding domain-containing protein [Pseudobacter ginsenosidimutans]RZS72487.1 flagellum-specific peptidoglycan hydrolase FlgJ [Pseudobacter ginsenosidimutans]